MQALVSVNGVDLPEPSSYSATTSTIVDSGRNVQGKVVGSVVRNDVAKVAPRDCEYCVFGGRPIHYKLLLHGTILQSSNSFLFHTSDVCFRPNGRNVAKGPKHRKCDGLDGLFFEPG